MPVSSPSGSTLSPEILQAVERLGALLASRPEVDRLKRAHQEIGRHEAARVMLRDLRERERRLAEKERAGTPPTEQEVEELRKVAEVVGFNPYVREWLDAQWGVAVLLSAVYQLLEQHLGLPRLEEEEEGQGPGAPGSPRPPGQVQAARRRLWVPGQASGA